VPHPFAFFLAKGWETTNPFGASFTPYPAHKSPAPHPVILSERSESKDLRLVFLAKGWETTNPFGASFTPCPAHKSPAPHPVILSERSESKDLRLVFLAKGWETTNPPQIQALS
jgi:hydrogenase maturation factor